jgi:AraC-like DNA-binding protein
MIARAPLRFLHSGWAEYPAGTVYGPRQQQEWQFVWMTRGIATWTVDGHPYRLEPGMVTLSQPGMRDSYRWEGPGTVCHGMVIFILDHPAGLPPIRHAGADSVLLPLLHHIVSLGDDPRSAVQRDTAIRLILLAWASGHHQRPALLAQSPGHPAVAAALDQLRQLWTGKNLSQPSVPVLARRAGISAAHLTRLFRNELGASPQEAMRLIRLDHAADLVATTAQGLDTIARRCGFTDARHLARWFRRAFGISPRAYRHRIAAGGPPVYIPLVGLRERARRLKTANGPSPGLGASAGIAEKGPVGPGHVYVR